ncbi:hypothetical protein [Comamonas guangdongensis]|uniref:DUF2169 domain-containing protein n=1 Tax=Comamonas guangdongensis TaxID=510515 RepID=A0ABV3ZWY1_9BURK
MTDARLIFKRKPATDGRLVFGLNDSGEVGVPGVDLSLDGELPELTLVCDMAYDSRAQRPMVSSTVAPWRSTDELQAGIASGMQGTIRSPAGWQARWQTAQAQPEGTEARQAGTLRPGDMATAARHQDGEPLQTSAAVQAQSALRSDIDLQARHQVAAHMQRQAELPHQDGLHDRFALQRVRHQVALPLVAGLATDFQSALPWLLGIASRWQEAVPPPPGISKRPGPPVDPEPPIDRCYVPDPHLVFGAAAVRNGRLIFVCECKDDGPGALIVAPTRKAYIVLNQVMLTCLDTGVELQALAFSMSLDFNSWTWTWSASLHKDAAHHLGRDAQGDPAVVLAVVNGVPFKLRLERTGRDRRFMPQERWAVSGRGLAAVISEPWGKRLPFGNPGQLLTAQQLAVEALKINGVSIGWGVDWKLEDWVVPAGAWAMQGSYIDAINDIASAAGGYVQPHNTEQILRILPKYPTAPWAWGDVVPDFEIPAAAAEVEGTEFMDKPIYNRVFVGGISAGVFGPVTRAGTAGELIAPQATHALITDATAQRQRGLAELADTGRQAHVSLSMQVLPETGVILPGQFVRYKGPETVMGIVRSTAINWAAPRLRQVLEVETHA